MVDTTLPLSLAMKELSVGLGLLVLLAVPLNAQDLETRDVRVTLDAALPIAQRAATTAFPDLQSYLLYSITPRVLKGDAGGLHWQVRWQELAFPHQRWLIVRVYMNDGHTVAVREASTHLPSPAPGARPH